MTKIALAQLAFVAGLLGTTVALAEEGIAGRNPWDWQDGNRASIAAMIEQKKGGLFESGSGGSGAGGGCGGSAGHTLAIQNYTCIIINHSNAAIQGSQNGAGNQTATTDTQASVNGAASTDLSAVLQALIGNH